MADLAEVAKLRAAKIDALRAMNAHLAREGDMILQSCEEMMAFESALRRRNFEMQMERQRLLRFDRQSIQAVPLDQREAMERGDMGRGAVQDQSGETPLQGANLINRLMHQRQLGEWIGEVPDSFEQKCWSPRISAAYTDAADLLCQSGRPSAQFVDPSGLIPPTNPIEHPTPWIVDNASLRDPVSDFFINARTSDFTGLVRFSC